MEKHCSRSVLISQNTTTPRSRAVLIKIMYFKRVAALKCGDCCKAELSSCVGVPETLPVVGESINFSPSLKVKCSLLVFIIIIYN